MTRVFNDDGIVTPVTVVQTGPMKAIQDRGHAIQFSYQAGKKTKKKEIKTVATVGDEITIGDFKTGDQVKVTGISKAKGFQGAVKRHGFHGMPASHGHHHVMRHVGSIGQRFPQHTLKGLRMAGRMGGRTTTTRGLKVVSVDTEKNILALKGAVPGKRGSWLAIQTL